MELPLRLVNQKMISSPLGIRLRSKKPTPPVSRTATPAVVGRTPSPFLNAGNANGNGNGIARTASPLAGGAAPAASRTTSSAALRKGSAIGSGPRKANVLGAKKTKLGAKKVTGD